MLTLSNVSKIYENNVKAIDGISIAIEDTGFVCIAGPSGCGKSTKSSNDLTHGYGLATIQELTNKYDGNMSYELIDGEFMISLLLKNCRSHRTIAKFNKRC